MLPVAAGDKQRGEATSSQFCRLLWYVVWLATGVVGAVVLSAPQVAELVRDARIGRSARALAGGGKGGFEPAAAVKD